VSVYTETEAEGVQTPRKSVMRYQNGSKNFELRRDFWWRHFL